jgi:hypothetical protein
VLIVLFLPILFFISLIARFLHPSNEKPKVVFGCDPLLNNKYWSAALRERGYDSVSISADLFYFSNAEDFDIVLVSNL